MRTCLGCNQAFPPEMLLRMISGPDGEVAIDVRQRADGRGAYVCCRRSYIEALFKKRRLTRALRSPGASSSVEALLAQAGEQLQARLLHLMAMAQKSGRVVSGTASVMDALEAERIRFLIAAEDAGAASLEKLTARSGALGIPTYVLRLSRDELGHLLGKGSRSVAAFRDGSLAEEMEKELHRLSALGS